MSRIGFSYATLLRVDLPVRRADAPPADAGWMAAMAVVVLTVLMVAAAVTTLTVATSASAARRNADVLVARNAALSGAELFFSAINSVPATSWLPACAGTETGCVVHSDVFPTSLSVVSDGAWVQLQGGGAVPCAVLGTPLASTCIQLDDTLQPDPDSPPGVNLYQITLQVDALTNCRHGVWGGATSVPSACVYSRILQRFTPRQYANYLDYTGSELLDPALYSGDGGSYETWLTRCTTGSPPEPVADTVATAEQPSVCVTPSYLGEGSVSGSATVSPRDVLTGPVATNDQTVYSCNNAATPPAIPDIEAVSTMPSSELPPTVTGSAPRCTGPAPAGQSVTPSPPPNDASSLAAVALPQDVFGSSGAPVDVAVTLDGSSATNSYTVGGGPPLPWPGAGVIYVYGNIAVSGEDCLPVTIATTGTISIVGNLFRDPTCPSAVTGLVATDGVTVVPAVVDNQIACWPVPVYGQCMTIDAAILALGAGDLPVGASPGGGSFSLSGWDLDASPLGSGGACPYDTVVSQAGAIDAWLLTDTTGGTAAWSGEGYPDPGTVAGGGLPVVTPGPLACDPSSAAAEFSPSDAGPITTPAVADDPTSLSIAAWFDTSSGGPVVSLADASSTSAATQSDRQVWVGTDGAVYFGVEPAPGDYRSISSPKGTSYADDRWHLAVATVSAAGITLSIDGRLVASDATVTSGRPGPGYWWIGAMEGPSSWPATTPGDGGLVTFDGEIGRVAVFPYALTTSENAELYNAAQAEPDQCAAVNVCALVFTGSYYERFRGAFGTYTTSSAGPVTETGVPKDFQFDTRLSESTPPYFLGPTSGGWLRSGATVTGGTAP